MKTTALAGSKCLAMRHRLRIDRNAVTSDDGTRVLHLWCTEQSCSRFGTAVASRGL